MSQQQNETPETREDGMWRHLEEPTPQPEHESAGTSAKLEMPESQIKRLYTPMMGMVITMVVLSLGLAALWMMNPEPDGTYTRDEDVEAAAAGTAQVTEYHPLAPEVPENWSANYARWETRPEHGVDVWEVGYTTEAVSFVGFAQTDQANPAWVNDETNREEPTGTETIGGLEFETRGEGDRRYWVLEAEENSIDGTTVIIAGDAQGEEMETALESMVEAIGEEVDDEGEFPGDGDFEPIEELEP